MMPAGTQRAPAPEDVPEALERLARAIEGSPHNLMSHAALAQLRERHLPECAALAACLPEGPMRLVDIGSGAGLPGLVIAVRRPDLQVELIEATRKKARFLDRMALELGRPGVRVHHGRAEELGRSRLAGAFDLATARAVAPLARLIPSALLLLRPHGRLYAVKGADWEGELADARAAAQGQWTVVATPEDQHGIGCVGRAPRVVIIARTQ